MASVQQAQLEMDSLVREVSKEISLRSGVILGDKQHSMVANRLRGHFIKKGVKSASEFKDLWLKNYEVETEELLGLLTTHHTFFYREFIHFEYLKRILPELVKKAQAKPDKTIRIWSSACSRGHEVYSLACFFEVHLKEIDPTLKYKITGTDVDINSVKYAENGVFPFREVKEIPTTYLRDFWVRGTGKISEFAKIKKSIRENCEFKQFNLVTPGNQLDGKKFDIIFCRNVFIYFTPDQVKKCTELQSTFLDKGGLFIIGISESLHGISNDMEQVGTSVYIRKQESSEFKKQSSPASTQTGPMRVLCVDDSATVLNLLKTILTRDASFKIVGTAKSGIEAQDFLKSNSVDLITLDLHMPDMDGLTFLEKNMSPQLPPVLIVSSVSRENLEVAQRALALGAKDYVEKPEFSKLELSGEQIRTKLKSIASYKAKVQISQVDKEFARVFSIPTPERMLRVIVAGEYGDRLFLQALSKTNPDQPPMVCYLGGNYLDVYNRLSAQEKSLVVIESSKLERGKILIRNINQVELDWKTFSGFTKTSIFFGRSLSAFEFKELNLNNKNAQMVFDDGISNSVISEDLVRALRGAPFTSFFSISEEYFCENSKKAA
jgi:chemotaxis protein methyltransferase CheR